MSEKIETKLALDLLGILHGAVKKIPEAITTTTESASIEKSPSFEERFKQNCVSAGYNVFQLVDCQIKKEGLLFATVRPPVYGASADSHRTIENWVARNISRETTEKLERRMRQLQAEQSERVRIKYYNKESTLETNRTGNSIVVLANGEKNSCFLIVNGAISAEVGGTWTGGRSNFNNSVVFRLSQPEVADEFVRKLDLDAKGYDAGTITNYSVLLEAIKGVFPTETVYFAGSHMFHRQEIQAVIDLRKK